MMLNININDTSGTLLATFRVHKNDQIHFVRRLLATKIQCNIHEILFIYGAKQFTFKEHRYYSLASLLDTELLKKEEDVSISFTAVFQKFSKSQLKWMEYYEERLVHPNFLWLNKFKNLSQERRNNFYVALAAVDQHFLALHYVPDNLKNDPAFILESFQPPVLHLKDNFDWKKFENDHDF